VGAERVFVVDRAAFFGGDWPQGFVTVPGGPDDFLAAAHGRGRFVDRAQAERNPDWKQWIPYCVVRCGIGSDSGSDAAGPAGGAGVFVVRRTRGQSEARLHQSRSIGIGGHVEPPDAAPAAEGTGRAFFARALGRELAEELTFGDAALPAPRLLGIVNDDATPVGQVHAGLVYGLDLRLPLPAAQERVGIREITKMVGGFVSLVELRELWQDPAQFESWSRFLIRAGIVGATGGRSWNGPTPVRRNTGPES
jgi:predicted NUDIX family phosphoesterase